MADLMTTHALADLVTLIVLEIVLGIDNLVILAILVSRLEPDEQPRARKVGLMLAMITRCMLLTTVNFIARLTHPLFTIPNTHFEVSGRDLVLLAGGMFLIAKATQEIHDRLEEGDEDEFKPPSGDSFVWIVCQIAIIDIVFSLDSVITAVGIADHLIIMILAVIIAVWIMLWFSGPLSEFINGHPSIKMLALTFLVLIGVMLIAEATHPPINKGYIYFAMAYSLGVEVLNLRSRKRKASVPADAP